MEANKDATPAVKTLDVAIVGGELRASIRL
jgi:hypothetical protein